VLQDSGLVCAPQFACGLTGMSAYYITHAWFSEQLSAVAPELFRLRLEVEPKLRFVTHLALMTAANMTMLTRRLPPKLIREYEGDFNRWYPLYRRIPMIARVTANRRMLLHKAERLLKIRFSDSPDPIATTPSVQALGASDRIYA
jgi:hypothetical protein